MNPIDTTGLTSEQSDKLAAFAASLRGEPWEIKNSSGWSEPAEDCEFANYLLAGFSLRPAPKPDRWAKEKEAHKAGKTIEWRESISGVWSRWFPCDCDPAFMDRPEREYRIKPWDLESHCLKHFGKKPKGAEFQGRDWTEDMLPDGWRPALKGEDTPYCSNDDSKDSYSHDGRSWVSIVISSNVDKNWGDVKWFRTRRPYPTPPRMVPLSREDVPLNSWFQLKGIDYSPYQFTDSGMSCACGFSAWSVLQRDKWLISRDFGKTWERCEKEAKP